MTKRRSYPLTFAPIREYWTKIESGQEVVSQKIYRTYRHIVRRMDGECSEYFYDPRRANHVIEFVESRHTPRNSLLRAVRKGGAISGGTARAEYESLVTQWSLRPRLAALLEEKRGQE